MVKVIFDPYINYTAFENVSIFQAWTKKGTILASHLLFYHFYRNKFCRLAVERQRYVCPSVGHRT